MQKKKNKKNQIKTKIQYNHLLGSMIFIMIEIEKKTATIFYEKLKITLNSEF